MFVVIGNPPYNARQANENDNNKNKPHAGVDAHVRETRLLRTSNAQSEKQTL